MNILFPFENNDDYFNVESLKINQNNNKEVVLDSNLNNEIPTYEPDNNFEDQVKIFKNPQNINNSESNSSIISQSSSLSNLSEQVDNSCKLSKDYTPCKISNEINHLDQSDQSDQSDKASNIIELLKKAINNEKNIFSYADSICDYDYDCDCNLNCGNSKTKSKILTSAPTETFSDTDTNSISSWMSMGSSCSNTSETKSSTSTFKPRPKNNLSNSTDSDYMINFLKNSNQSNSNINSKKLENYFKNESYKTNKKNKVNININLEELEQDVTICIGKKLTIRM